MDQQGQLILSDTRDKRDVGWLVTESELRAVETPPDTRSYAGVPYGYLLDQSREVIGAHGLTIRQERFALARGGDQMFAMFDMEPMQGRDTGFCFGLRSSHDKSYPVDGAGGESVMACVNRILFGEITLSRRHTTYVLRDLPTKFSDVFGQLYRMYGDWQQVTDQLRTTGPLDRVTVNDWIMEAVRAKACAASQITAVLGEFESPTLEVWRERELDGWRLFNAFTEVAKRWSAPTQWSKTQRLSSVFANRMGVDMALQSSE
jgi:hypothetical protein